MVMVDFLLRRSQAYASALRQQLWLREDACLLFHHLFIAPDNFIIYTALPQIIIIFITVLLSKPLEPLKPPKTPKTPKAPKTPKTP